MLYTSLSTAAQTAYAALASASRLENVRTVAELPGSFSRKVVKGKEYWYYQTPDLTGKQMQIFLGSASDELTKLIELHRSGGGEKVHLRQLTRQAIAAGCPSIVPSHAKMSAQGCVGTTATRVAVSQTKARSARPACVSCYQFRILFALSTTNFFFGNSQADSQTCA
jgi:hypothetical protein